MSIPLKNDKKIIKSKKYHFFNEEQYNILSNKLLNEKLGSFEYQYELSLELSHIIYDMYEKNIYNFSYNTNNELIGIININLNTNGLFVNISARFEGINEKNETVLIINISKNFKNLNKDIFIKQITNAVSHELMHSNVIQQKLKNNINIDDILDIPEYYNYIIYMMGQSDEDSILYWYSRALYVTYYQEVNAIVSQTHVQIFNQLGYGKQNTNDDIRKTLIKTEPYITYSTILNDIIPTIKKMTDKEIYDNISKHYETILGINDISVDFIKKSLNKIENISKKALHNICRNAMIEGKSISKIIL